MYDFKITNSDSIQSLFSKKNRNKFERIKIDVEGLDKSRAKEFEKKINRYFFSCGCETGAIFSFSSILVYILIGMLYFKKTSIFNWQSIKYGLLILLTGALLGKIIGLLYAKYKLRITIKKLKSEISKI
ncbi:MAG: hypothetical protein ACE5WD_06595 [Candidatus Aminicenantia bacterium]